MIELLESGFYRKHLFRISSFLFLFLFVIPNIFSQGDLLVFPKRLVFEGSQDRVKILNLNNKGKDTAVYQLSYIENKMDIDGRLISIQDSISDFNFASPYLRFYPRTIKLAPGETQTIKVQLVRSGNLSTGEYRSHLYFKPVIQTKEVKTKHLSQDSQNLSIELKPIFGLSIANIIRIGNPKVHIELTNLALQELNDGLYLSVVLNRSGLASSYGNLSVTYIALNGKETEVGKMQGVGVYTPGDIRKTIIKLKTLEGVNYNSGKLKVSFVSQGTGRTVLAEATLDIN